MEWIGTPTVLGSSWTTQYVLVTLAIAGLQFVWSIEQAYVNVYLLDLGMTKSMLSLLWLAGPLCGLIVQPAIGVISDFSTSRHGRRRPFMVWGSLTVALGLLGFGWAPQISTRIGTSSVAVAVSAILVVDVAVNTCQACCRALIVDMFSASRQAEVNSWASCMASLGHLTSYYLGSVDLTKLGFETQMKAAAVLYSVVLIVCVAISATAAKERVLVRRSMRNGSGAGSTGSGKRSVFSELGVFMRQLWRATLSLDYKLRAIFKVQLFAWYAWFTFLFYGSTYACEVWRIGKEVPPTTGELARAGSMALAIFSLSATIFTFVLPKVPASMTKIWTYSFVTYAITVLSTYWVKSYAVVLVLFAVIGFPWAATLWVPFALTSKRIHELPGMPEIDHSAQNIEHFADNNEAQPILSSSSSIPNSDGSSVSESTLHVLNSGDVPDGHDEQSGIILGIHNSALTLPQFVSTFGSYVIFQLLDADPERPHDDQGRAIAVTLQVGAIAAFIAAIYSAKLNRI